MDTDTHGLKPYAFICVHMCLSVVYSYSQILVELQVFKGTSI